MARDEGLRAVAQGKIDLLCEATVPTLASRKEVSLFDPDLRERHRRGACARMRRTRLKDILSGPHAADQSDLACERRPAPATAARFRWSPGRAARARSPTA